jgi:sucrose-6-phosphate hydrolase SacC (GH32 family)
LREDGRLGVEPIEELQSLRTEKLICMVNKSSQEVNKLLKNVKGDMLEIRLELYSEKVKQFGIKVRCSPEGEEETLIYYDQVCEKFNVNREKTSLNQEELTNGVQGGKLELNGENLRLHIFLDRSMLEAYANGLKSLTTRVYPSRKDSLGLKIWGNVTVKSIEVWKLKSIQPN